MTFPFFLLLATALFSRITADANSDFALLNLSRQRRPRPCGEFCTFRGCNTNGTFFRLPLAPFWVLGAPRNATSPFICIDRPGKDVFEVLETGEARIFYEDLFIPISKWRPPSLSNLFPKNFFQTYLVQSSDHSGIGRLPTTGNQWDFLHDRCLILPILKYATGPGHNPKVVSTSGGINACVAFRTTAPAMHVQLNWNSNDDFDLGLIEPDGDFLEFFNGNTRTEAGKLNGDNNKGLCNVQLPGGKEDIVYFPGGPIERGDYETFITHPTSCSKDPSEWVLRLVKRGVVQWVETGKITATSGVDFFSRKFSYP